MARAVLKRLAQGLPAVEPPAVKPESFAAVADNWLKRHVHKNGVRTAVNIERVLKFIRAAQLVRARVHCDPTQRHRRPARRRRGARAAPGRQGGGCAAVDRQLVRRPQRRLRQPVRAHQVAGAEGGAAAQPGPQRPRAARHLESRRRKRCIRRADPAPVTDRAAPREGLEPAVGQSSPTGIWTIRTAPREKGNAGELQLPTQALAIVQAQPRLVGSPFVFATRGAFNSRVMGAFRAACGVHGWRLHDLRRTAGPCSAAPGCR